MKQWLLFEMSKNSLEEKKPTEAPPKEPLDMEDLSSGLGVTRQELGQGKGGDHRGGHPHADSGDTGTFITITGMVFLEWDGGWEHSTT